MKKLDGRRLYRLYRCGPGDGSTYSNCWGQHSTSRGDLIADGAAAEIERAIMNEGGWDDGLMIYEYDSKACLWQPM